jgi:hypothetical protein
MFPADTKDWTWVLERPCPECGFEAGAVPVDSISGLVRQNAATWARLLREGVIGPARPDPSIWSALEYACHVRDVYRRYDGRIELMLTEEDPLFPNWDQDATAREDGYQEQAPAKVVSELSSAAEGLAGRLDGIAGPEWDRIGRRSDGATFTVASISRYMIHDPVHHVWDVTDRQRS